MIRRPSAAKRQSKQAHFCKVAEGEKIFTEPEMSTEPLSAPWQEFARELLQDAIAQRGLNYPQLSELLAETGYEGDVKALARRVNRGTFDAGFLLMCLTALGTVKVNLQVEGVVDVTLKPERTWKRGRPLGRTSQ
jgi:Domain of unknown function (DUF6471)